MRILITGSHSLLGRTLANSFAREHSVETLDLAAKGDGPEPTHVGDPRDRDFASRATAGCDAVIHSLSMVHPDDPPHEVLDAAARQTYNLLSTAASATRFILLSSLRMFERYPTEWLVSEWWAPRPTTDVADLAPYVAELTVRESARVMPIRAIGLRLGEVVDSEHIAGRPADPRWLHVEDAVRGVRRALEFEPPPDEQRSGWWVFHIVGAGRRTRFPLGLAGQPPFSYSPKHDLAAGLPPPASSTTAIESPPPKPTRNIPTSAAIRRVVIFGAGGPLASATTEALARDHALRLTDVRSLDSIIAENKPQSTGAPLPRILESPHEERVVDVSDPAQVMEATRGMDAMINCTVTRRHPVTDFRVNMIGAYNVMRAAVRHGIRRVVHTGPAQVTHNYPAGYWYEFGVPADVPARPCGDLYGLTKFLGQEICRIFAEEHGLEVPALLFGNFNNPSNPHPPPPPGAWVMLVSWQDAAEAVRLALRAPSFPSPFEVMHITGDMPHGKYPNDKAKKLLGWQPRDRFEDQWLREP